MHLKRRGDQGARDKKIKIIEFFLYIKFSTLYKFYFCISRGLPAYKTLVFKLNIHIIYTIVTG